jgi:hypothetical protein
MTHPSGTVTFIFRNMEGSTNCSASGNGTVKSMVASGRIVSMRKTIVISFITQQSMLKEV